MTTATETREMQLARWWVDLNRWIWPDDLLGKPQGDEAQAGRGAFAVVDALADSELVDQLWQEACQHDKPMPIA